MFYFYLLTGKNSLSIAILPVFIIVPSKAAWALSKQTVSDVGGFSFPLLSLFPWWLLFDGCCMRESVVLIDVGGGKEWLLECKPQRMLASLMHLGFKTESKIQCINLIWKAQLVHCVAYLREADISSWENCGFYLWRMPALKYSP